MDAKESELEEFIHKRLEALEKDRHEAMEAMARVREQIQKADAKRGDEDGTEYYHKWSEILRNLEGELDKARVHLTAIDAEIHEKQQRADELRQKADAELQAKRDALDRILKMNPDELAALSMEEMAILQEYELGQLTFPEPSGSPPQQAPEQAEEGQGAAGVQSASSPEEHPTGSSPHSKSPAAAAHGNQRRLGEALRKAVGNDYHGLSLRDIDLLIDFCASTSRHSQDDAKTAHLVESVSKTLEQVDAEYTRIHEKLGGISIHTVV